MRERMVLLGLLLTIAMGAAAAEPVAPAPSRYAELYARLGDPGLLWLMAEDYASQDRKADALEALQRTAEARAGFFPGPDAALNRFKGDPAYDRLVARMAAELPEARRGRVLFTLDRPGLVPEGIAYDPGSRRLFIGDMTHNAVLAVSLDGKVSEFARGLRLPPLGMMVDRRRGLLWVATTSAFGDAPRKEAALVALDLAGGRVVRTATSPQAISFNDLALAPNGDIYATDTTGEAVFRLPAGSDALERITPAGDFSYANGVAVSGDGRFLYVAQGLGLRRIDLATREIIRVAAPKGQSLLGIDGLYWRDGELIAVQNSAAGRVLRLQLDAEGRKVEKLAVLEAGDPVLDVPTTAAPAEGRLYLLANAQIYRLKGDGTVAAGLRPIVVLEVPLRP